MLNKRGRMITSVHDQCKNEKRDEILTCCCGSVQNKIGLKGYL